MKDERERFCVPSLPKIAYNIPRLYQLNYSLLNKLYMQLINLPIKPVLK